MCEVGLMFGFMNAPDTRQAHRFAIQNEPTCLRIRSNAIIVINAVEDPPRCTVDGVVAKTNRSALLVLYSASSTNM